MSRGVVKADARGIGSRAALCGPYAYAAPTPPLRRPYAAPTPPLRRPYADPAAGPGRAGRRPYRPPSGMPIAVVSMTCCWSPWRISVRSTKASLGQYQSVTVML
ncbi:hypothetical protein OJJOAM_003837 [Cupriavidus sp. H18C1]